MKMVPDALWAVLAPLIPPAPSHARGGRPRVPDRTALAGILFVPRTGCPCAHLPSGDVDFSWWARAFRSRA